MRTAGWAGSVRANWQVTGGVLKIACRIWEVGVAGSPVIGRGQGGRFQHYCSSLDCGLPLVAFWQQKKRTHNVSKYMLVLALCLIIIVIIISIITQCCLLRHRRCFVVFV